MKKIFKFSLIVIMIVSLIIYINGIVNRVEKEEVSSWRTDRQPLINEFPRIVNFEKCYWKVEEIGKKGFFSVPGPTSYKIRGFLILEQTEFEALMDKYDWEYMNEDWQPSIDSDMLKLNTFKWSYSKRYDKFVISSSHVGQIYLDTENGIIFFELEA